MPRTTAGSSSSSASSHLQRTPSLIHRRAAARRVPQHRLTLALLVCCGARSVQGLRFTLKPEQTERCVAEPIPAKSLLTGDWEFAEVAGAASEIHITGPDGHTLFKKDGALSGHFVVTAQREGAHNICVSSTGASVSRSVTLNLKTALEVADHETVAKKEHVEAIEAELDRMKKMSVHVYEEMLYMRTRSDQQHATNASTRGRLLWVEVVMMLCVILMGFWQIRYLRNYFKAKKVI